MQPQESVTTEFDIDDEITSDGEASFDDENPDFTFEVMVPADSLNPEELEKLAIPEVNTTREVPVRCSGNLDYPHLSHHVTGTINAQARIKCPIRIESIRGTVTLTRDRTVTVSSGEVVKRDTRRWKANAALNCIRDGKSRYYKAVVKGSWTAYPHQKPLSGEFTHEKEAHLSCASL